MSAIRLARRRTTRRSSLLSRRVLFLSSLVFASSGASKHRLPANAILPPLGSCRTTALPIDAIPTSRPKISVSSIGYRAPIFCRCALRDYAIQETPRGHPPPVDRKSVGKGKSVSVRGDHGGRRNNK